jgi:hypothetical protein
MLAACLAGCGGRGPEPSRPDHGTSPTIVGVLASFDFVECWPGRFHLVGGHVVELPPY